MSQVMLLVAQGFTQIEGINFKKIFPLVARLEAIQMTLAFASFKDFNSNGCQKCIFKWFYRRGSVR